MIHSALYREPVPLDPAVHRGKRVRALNDFSIAQGMHAVFVTAGEFAQAALEFALIFVPTGDRPGERPVRQVSPVALLGVRPNENLHVDGSRWDAGYLPAFIRRYPYLTAPVRGADAPGIYVDAAWPGFNDSEGEPLFDADGKPTAALDHALDFMRLFDAEASRTRELCARIVELDVLKGMKADMQLAGGEHLSVDGFLTVDEDKLRALPDATIVELHRSGLLAVLHAHLLSLGNLRRLIERKSRRLAQG